MAKKTSGWRQTLAGERQALADALWPPACWLCRRPAADGFACPEHALSSLEVELAAGGPRPARCGLCSRRLAPGTQAQEQVAAPWLPSGVGTRQGSWRRCRLCRLQAPGFGRLLALDDYPGELRPWILALKHGRRDLAVPLARLLKRRLESAGWLNGVVQRPILVPVPAHALRRLERGVDAPDLLARALALETGWRVRRLLRRRRFTSPQGEPGSASRSANVSGAFGLGFSGWLRFGLSDSTSKNTVVVLVDDVGSSGATLSECARLLRKAGAASVGAVCLARAQRAQ